MKPQTLHVRVGEDLTHSLARTAQTMHAIEQGQRPEPSFELGFENIAQLLAVFTPKRWELLAALRRHGPLSIFALARLLQRDYKNVHADVAALLEWTVIEKNAQNLIVAPFADIAMDVRLPQQQAA